VFHLGDALEEAAQTGGAELRRAGQGEHETVAAEGAVTSGIGGSVILTAIIRMKASVAERGGESHGNANPGSKYNSKSKGNYPTQAKGWLEMGHPCGV